MIRVAVAAARIERGAKRSSITFHAKHTYLPLPQGGAIRDRPGSSSLWGPASPRRCSMISTLALSRGWCSCRKLAPVMALVSPEHGRETSQGMNG